MENSAIVLFVKRWIFLIIVILVLGVLSIFIKTTENNTYKSTETKNDYWFILHRKSNIEYLYQGKLGSIKGSKMIKKFTVKTGIPGERPTPLPRLVGKEYWLITDKSESKDNPETAPYFLTLNIPAPTDMPFGPEPYLECGGGQCQWELPGECGLHGVNGDESRLSAENPGSSGCIRHTDSDITYLYSLLNPETEEIRYYIEDK